MAAILPQNIPVLSANAIASYDYIDLSSGLGFINYKGFTTQDSSGIVYNLGTNTVYSATIETAATGTQPVHNFDSSTFNLPRTAKGTAYVSAGCGTTAAGTFQPQVRLQKIAVDGTTITNISAAVSGAALGGSGTTVAMELIPIPLTQTTIGVGEKLRLTFLFSENGNPAGFGHDPQGRSGARVSGASVTTALNCYIPFRIYN